MTRAEFITRLMPERCTALLPVCLCLSVAATTSLAAEPEAHIEVSADGTQVSLNAVEVPLIEILGQLAIKANFGLKLRGNIDETVTIEFHDTPISDALARLLRHKSYAISYDHLGEPELPRLPARLIVVNRAEAAQQPTKAMTPGEPTRSHRLTPEDQEQLETIRGLRRGNPAEAVRPLTALLRGAANPRVRQSAVAALAEIDAVTALRAVKDAIDDPDPAVRQQALRELIEIDADAAAGELREVLRSHRDPAMRAFAVEALAMHTDAESIAVLRAAAKDPHPLVSDAAQHALLRVGG